MVEVVLDTTDPVISIYPSNIGGPSSPTFHAIRRVCWGIAVADPVVPSKIPGLTVCFSLINN